MRPIVRPARSRRRRRSQLAGALAAASALATVVSLAGISTALATMAWPALPAHRAHANAASVPPAKLRTCARTASTLVTDCTPPTFTHVSGAPNPTFSRPFKVTAMECDRVADVYATGTMTFVDVTTGVTLGTVTLSPSRKYVNCGQAEVTDHERLRAGRYKIRASYTPGGAVPVHASAPAHYHESVRVRHSRHRSSS